MMDNLRLDRVGISNYRCFAECDVRLHPKLTVFVAENGRGKTAILDALSIALGPVVDEFTGIRQWARIESGDVRQVRQDGYMAAQVPTALSARGVIDGESLEWQVRRAVASTSGRTSTRDSTQLRKGAAALKGRLDSYSKHERKLPPPLPLIAYYGTGRLWAEQRLTEGRRRRDPSPLGRLSGYQDCLSSASSFKAFAAWYGYMMNAARNPTSVAADPNENPVKLLAAVRDATRVVLDPTGWTDLDWDFPPQGDESQTSGGQLVVEHPLHGKLPLSRLSDGVRNMIALVADVAHRCVRLNPHFGIEAARSTPGVLLIDEVDMHLHPGWQQEVVGLLQQAFPRLQLVVTTHSPQVLSTVDSESIYMLSITDGKGALDQPAYQTRGVESADVLARVMGVHAVPKVKEAQWLSLYRALVQAGEDDTPEAKKLLIRLVDHFGEQHPVMHEVNTLQRLQQFKRAHASTPKEGR
jgi:predicted ATP-binding protein involved in virulence